MADVGFLGTGAISAAMVEGLAGHGHRITISERNASMAAKLSKQFAEVTVADNQTVLDRSDVVILCLMARVAPYVLEGLQFRADHTVLSVMADMPLARLSPLIAPASGPAIFIPMPFVAQGNCPLPVTPDSPTLRALFGDRNLILPCRDETALAAHFPACALASVIFAELDTAADWLAPHTGDRANAEAYLVALMAGYLGAMPQDGAMRLAAELSALNTEGGFNAALRTHMAPARDRLLDGLEELGGRLEL